MESWAGAPTVWCRAELCMVCLHGTRVTNMPHRFPAINEWMNDTLFISSGWKRKDIMLVRRNSEALCSFKYRTQMIWQIFVQWDIASQNWVYVGRKFALYYNSSLIPSTYPSCLSPYRATGFWSKAGGSWTMTSPSMPISTWRMASLSKSSTAHF